MKILNPHFPELNSIRGFAALWVMLFHAWALYGQPQLAMGVGDWKVSSADFFAVGWAGVDVFFTLSAFLLTFPFAAWQLENASKPNLGVYFTRRILRIFPAYYAQLLILLLLAIFFGVGRTLNFHDLIAHLGLWLFMGKHPVMPLNGVWWTLPTEFGFYLMLPVLAYLLRPKWWIILVLASIAATWTYRMAAYQWVADLPIPNRANTIELLPGHLDQFVIGMVAAYAFVATRLRMRILSEIKINLLFATGTMGLIAMCLWIIPEAKTLVYWNGSALLIFWHTAASVAIALILLALCWQTSLTKRLFGNCVFYYLGEISFGIYLWHFPILHWTLPLFEKIQNTDLRFIAALGIALPCTILAAHLSYRLIERPCLGFKNFQELRKILFYSRQQKMAQTAE